MVQIPSPLGRLPIAWVVEAAISVLSQQPPARLLWRTEGAAGASVIYRGGKVADKPVLLLRNPCPQQFLTPPFITHPTGEEHSPVKGFWKPGEEFGALWLQLVHCCCWVNTQHAGSAERNFMSFKVCYLRALFVLGYNESFSGKTQQLWIFRDKQRFESLCTALKWNLSMSLPCGKREAYLLF